MTKKNLTKVFIDDKLIIMNIQDTLRKLVTERGLRKTARDLEIDSGSLFRSINSDLRVSTAQMILKLFGYDLKIVKRKGVKKGKEGVSKSKKEKGVN